MIKRIQEIKCVGCFKKMTAPSLQFEPITIIYGENTYGKSTLCDVLRSLADGNPEYITNRKSIPNPNGISQSVEINFETSDDSKEVTYKFKREKWEKTLPDDLQLLVFDTNFIYRNVFTGLTIERNNYENVTQFVLGEESVTKAEKIAETKSELRRQKKKLKKLKTDSFEGIQNIKEFIELDVQDDLESLSDKMQQITSKLSNQIKLKENIEDIRAKKEPTFLNQDADLSIFIEDFNSILESSIEQVHEEVKDKVLDHIKNKTQNLETTQTWIFKGLDHIKDEECPFCGQDLDGAIELIELYSKFYEPSYKKKMKEIRSNLSKAEKTIKKFQFENVKTIIDKNKVLISQYNEIKANSFNKKLNKLEKTSKTVNKKLGLWEKNYPKFVKKIKGKIQHKQNAIGKEMGPFHWNDGLELFNSLRESITEYETILKEILEQINKFKSSLDTEESSEKIKKYKAELKDMKLQKRRLESSNACQSFLDLEQEITQTQSLKERLEEELEKEQTKFLDKYFEDINKIFKKLGSTNFSINKKVSRRGDLPTIQLKAKYNGKIIKKNKIKAFFSESDRRALALAIFWAKIESFSEVERRKTTVVLDDPVTSFDDGRVEQSIRLFNLGKYNLKQLIIISHYPRYLKLFFDQMYNESDKIKLLELEKDQIGSKLVEANSADFVETPHQKMFRKIKKFINRKHDKDILKDLRIYLENELKSRYHNQIVELSLENELLKNLINGLNKNDVIEDELAFEIHDFRKSLNPSHHVARERSKEEIISLAQELMDFIYNKI